MGHWYTRCSKGDVVDMTTLKNYRAMTKTSSCFLSLLMLLSACGNPPPMNNTEPAKSKQPDETIEWQPDYEYVRAYQYNLDSERSDYIVVDGRLHPTVVDTMGVELSDHQVTQVLGIVNGTLGTDEDIVAECFIPRHGLVFYDSQRKPTAHISICFECNQLRVEPDNDLPNRGMPLFKRLFHEMGFLHSEK